MYRLLFELLDRAPHQVAPFRTHVVTIGSCVAAKREPPIDEVPIDDTPAGSRDYPTFHGLHFFFCQRSHLIWFLWLKKTLAPATAGTHDFAGNRHRWV